jgi:hypothetical protein
MLHCEQCGCSGDLGTGWVTVVHADLEEIGDKPWIGELCPPCAAAELGYRPDVAENYVCVWQHPSSETAAKAP